MKVVAIRADLVRDGMILARSYMLLDSVGNFLGAPASMLPGPLEFGIIRIELDDGKVIEIPSDGRHVARLN